MSKHTKAPEVLPHFCWPSERAIEQKEDPTDQETQMLERIENFQKAMKDPTKRLTPNPEVKHDVHQVSTLGFNPHAQIHVEDIEDPTDPGPIRLDKKCK